MISFLPSVILIIDNNIQNISYVCKSFVLFLDNSIDHQIYLLMLWKHLKRGYGDNNRLHSPTNYLFDPFRTNLMILAQTFCRIANLSYYSQHICKRLCLIILPIFFTKLCETQSIHCRIIIFFSCLE